MLKKLFTHSLLYSIAPIFIQVASLLLLPFLTPYLSSLDYGIYGIITSYLFFIAALKDLGFGVLFVNTFYKHPLRWPLLWRMFYGHLLYWSIIYFFLFVLILYIAIPQMELKNFPLILLLTSLPALIFDTASMLGNYYYRFSEKPKVVAAVSITAGIVSLAVTYYCIAVLKLGYLGWFFGSFASSFIMFLCFFYPVFIHLKLIPILQIRWRFINRYLKVALPMIPHNYSSYLLNSSDRVIMNLMRIDLGQIGLYNVGYRFGNYFETGGEALGMAVAPQFAKLYTHKTKEALATAKKLTFFFMLFFLLGCFTVSLWLKEVFSILFRNPELQPAYSIGIIILMGYAYRPMYWSVGTKLSVNDKTVSLWKISFVAGLINVLLNILFLKQYGIYAAAINTFISLLYIGFAGFYLSSYRKLDGPRHYPELWMSLIIGLTVLVYCLKDISITWKSIITLLSIGLFIYFLLEKKVFKIDDI
jgi:O-antigen/teichoic acid export membrane protein